MSSFVNNTIGNKVKSLAVVSATVLACVGSGNLIAAGDAGAGAGKAAVCAGCHGVDGNSVVPLYPKIAGQHAIYLASSLKAYQSQERKGGNAALMYALVANLSDQDIADLAAYFAAQTPK